MIVTFWIGLVGNMIFRKLPTLIIVWCERSKVLLNRVWLLVCLVVVGFNATTKGLLLLLLLHCVVGSCWHLLTIFFFSEGGCLYVLNVLESYCVLSYVLTYCFVFFTYRWQRSHTRLKLLLITKPLFCLYNKKPNAWGGDVFPPWLAIFFLYDSSFIMKKELIYFIDH